MAKITKRQLMLMGGSGGLLLVGVMLLTSQVSPAPVEIPPPETREIRIEVPVSEVEVLAATRDLIRGDVLMPGDFTWILWPESASSNILYDRDVFPDAISAVAGRAVLEPIFAGEPISQKRLHSEGGGTLMSTRVREGYRAFALPISALTGVSGFVLPNDRVDLIWAFQENELSGVTGEPVQFLTAQHVMQNVRVLSVDTLTFAEGAQGGALNSRNINVEVTPEQAEILTVGLSEGSFYFTLRGVLDSNENNGDPITLINPIEERYSALLPPEGGSAEAPPPPSQGPQIFRNGRPEGSS